MKYDCVIVGGGVIGLSIACELARAQLAVAVIERGQLGQEASAAAAGILPAVKPQVEHDPIDQLRALSHNLHPQWAQWLREETGIDTGFRRCGAVYVARTKAELGCLQGLKLHWQAEQVEFVELENDQWVELVPPLAHSTQAIRQAVLLPDECQLDNPQHLSALIAACRNRSVDLFEQTDIEDFDVRDRTLQRLQTTAGPFAADQFCIAAGAWSGRLLQQIDVQISILPVRGQMLAFRLPAAVFDPIVNDGSRYLVPRPDGWVLAGSTMEHAGFSKELTSAGQKGLYEFAHGLVPALDTTTLKRRWAGLRPGTFDGFPYLGRCPRPNNVIVATGHFRHGLHTSTGTAVVIAELILKNQSPIDLAPFRIARG